MLQFGGLGLDGSIEISVSVIVTVSQLVGRLRVSLWLW